MYRYALLAMLLLFNCVLVQKGLSQDISTISFTGKVKDVEHNYFLTTATVSLFKVDSTLISFQITDTYGAFSFNKVKALAPCFIKVSNVGYQTKRIDIKPDKNSAVLDLGIIEMTNQAINLNEVSIGISPVTMNGDTLEFNPAAFKLDSNAVLDDLLRKIPNVTVWNDGQITVNGREIKSLVVNGKPFFGTDFKVATQNLPKNIIQTIQVYKKEENRLNPLDSLLEMNIKLKKGMETGFFGKVSVGGGTNGRFETEGNINAYSRQLQVSVVGAANNTNKIANDVQTLLANSTFKSSGTDLSYQSNFRMPGDNRTSTAGVSLKYDVVEFPEFDNKNTVSFNHFFQRKNTDENAVTEAITTRETNDLIYQKSNNDQVRSAQQNNTSLNYDYVKDANKLYFQSYLTNSSSDVINQNDVTSFNNRNETLSSSTSAYVENSNRDNFSVYSRYTYTPPTFDHATNKKKFSPFSASYSGNFNNRNSFNNLKTAFFSEIDGTNKVFDRNRNSEEEQSDQKVEVIFDNIPQLLFGRGVYLLDFSIVGSLQYERGIRSDVVQDRKNDIYVNNSYLTADATREVLNNTYGINVTKIIGKRLSNRYEKNIFLRFGGHFNNILFDHSSTKDFQNINRDYFAFVPDGSISFSNNVFGRKRVDFSVNGRSYINIPQIDQLAPLLDSTQFYYFRVGNINLRQERIQQISLSYAFENLQRNNNFSYRIEAGYKFSDNKIIDSIFISPDSRQTIFPVNGTSYQSLSGSFEIRKALKFKSSDLKFQGYGSISKDYLPTFINSVFVINRNLTTNLGVVTGYGLNDLITLEVRENINYYQSEQPFYDTKFSGITFTHTLSFNYIINKKLFFNTNLNMNNNKSSGVERVNFNIWNAYLSQRFFKGNNAEIKLSALDILRQNRSIINRVETNRFITNSRNTLQQYFLVALSYYPRSFGKKSK